MRNKKLIPFKVIEKAVAGEPDRLKARLTEAILKFRFDRSQVAKTGKAVKGKLRVLRP